MSDALVKTPSHVPDVPDESMPLDQLVAEIHAGTVAATAVPAELRRRCVEHLTHEGFSTSEIAALLETSERTVRRDRATARMEGALKPTLTLSDELLGEFHRWTLSTMQRLTRLSRDEDKPAYARLWAEEAMIRNYQRFIHTAHKLEYLRTGRERLAHLDATDPEAHKRHKETTAARRRMIVGG